MEIYINTLRRHKRYAFFLALACVVFMLPSQAEAASNNGLVGYWSFNEGTSTIATDFSGSGNHGTLNTFADPPTASSGWTFGKRGKALQFDGSSDRVSIPDNTSLHSGDGTISMWVKSTTDLGTAIFSAMKGDSTLPGWTIEVGPSTGTLTDELITVFSEDGTYAVGYTTSDRNELFDGQWHHVVVTADTTTKIYIDGVAKTTSTGYGSDSGEFTSAAGIDSFRIGNSRYNSTENLFFTGALDEVRMYNRALTATEVAELYRAGTSLYKPVNNLGLIGYWSFNEATSTIATDFSGNGRHGTLSGNAVTWVSGKRGSALNFGGTDDNVTLGQLSAISAQQKITVSAWIYDTAGTASKSIVSRYTAGVPSFVFYVSDPGDGGGDDMEFNPDGAEAGYSTGNVHQTNRWEHWVVVYDGSQADADKITFYLNGTAQAETLTSTPVGATTDSSTNVVRIGADSDQAADFTGKIDEVRIYSRALSASEVANLYRAGATRIGVSSATLAQGTTLASGLTGLWTLDGKDTLWTSATGGSVLDGSGNVRTLTMSGMSRASSPAIGKLGQALSFNGTGTSLTTVTNLSTFVSASEATMAVWVKPTGTPSGVQMVITDDTFEDVYIQRDDASNFSVANWDGSGYDTITVPYTNNEWIHLVLVHTGGTLYAYKNGIFVNSTASGDTTNLADPLVIGASGGAKYFNGTIDEIRTYNRGLTASEVKQLYLLGQGVIKQ